MTKRVLFDLEGDGLLPTITTVHCIAAVDVDTGDRAFFGPTEIQQALDYLSTADVLIAHNGLRYDFPVLEKLHGFYFPAERQLDTLVLARLMFPDVRSSDADVNEARLNAGEETLGDAFGSHSLRAWGVRLKVQKGDFQGPWDKYTEEMGAYCRDDIATNIALWNHLNPDKYSQPAIALEHRTAIVCQKITDAGWPFDLQAAGTLHATLANKKAELEDKLAAEFSGWVTETVFTPKVNNKARGYVKGVPFTKRTPVTFNPNSRHHIARALKERGWVPVEFTENGQPKLDDEIIESIAIEFPAAGDIGEYLMVCKRLSQLADGDRALLKNVGEDLRIHAEYNPMGAVTSRASHFRPNIAQVPTCSSLYGSDFRKLFGVEEGWELVGADMEGLEIRALCHYLFPIDNGDFTKLALEGDIHWANVRAMGLAGDEELRDKHNTLHAICREIGAKRFFYAWLYGAGNAKAGKILLDACRAALKANPEWGHLLTRFFGQTDKAPNDNKLRTVGGKLKDRFLDKIPALKRLVYKVKGVAKTHQALPGLDGRRVPIRSLHAALNTLLQSCGAILCKRWLCDFYDAAIAEGYRYGWDGDFVILGWIHDEIQIATRNGLGDRLGRLLTDTAERAGASYGFRVPLASKYKIGRTWADTH